MTENKRFTFDGRDCFDNGEFWLDLSLPTYSNVKEICKMLNELNDENKELKAENEQLKEQIKELYTFVKCDVDNEIDVYPKSILEGLINILKIIGDVK